MNDAGVTFCLRSEYGEDFEADTDSERPERSKTQLAVWLDSFTTLSGEIHLSKISNCILRAFLTLIASIDGSILLTARSSIPCV